MRKKDETQTRRRPEKETRKRRRDETERSEPRDSKGRKGRKIPRDGQVDIDAPFGESQEEFDEDQKQKRQRRELDNQRGRRGTRGRAREQGSSNPRRVASVAIWGGGARAKTRRTIDGQRRKTRKQKRHGEDRMRNGNACFSRSKEGETEESGR